MKNFIQRFFSANTEKTQNKLNEMNDAICGEFKSRMRRVTAKHRGYEQFSKKSSGYSDLKNSYLSSKDNSYKLDDSSYRNDIGDYSDRYSENEDDDEADDIHEYEKYKMKTKNPNDLKEKHSQSQLNKVRIEKIEIKSNSFFNKLNEKKSSMVKKGYWISPSSLASSSISSSSSSSTSSASSSSSSSCSSSSSSSSSASASPTISPTSQPISPFFSIPLKTSAKIIS